MNLPERRFLITVFAARLVSGTARPGPEASEVAWVDADEIASFDTTEGLAESALAAARVFVGGKA